MTSATISARDLRALLTPILPLAGTDDTLPLLTGVLLRTQGKYLTATATDRYRLGICRHELPEAGDLTALIRARDLKQILAVFKPTRFDNPDLTFTVEDDKVTVTSGGTLSGMTAASLTFFLLEGEYPKVDSLLTNALAKEPDADGLAFNAGFLADFQHAIRHSEPLQVRPSGPLGATVVSAGDHFIGVIMPRRAEPASEALNDWAALLGGKPAKKGKAA